MTQVFNKEKLRELISKFRSSIYFPWGEFTRVNPFVTGGTLFEALRYLDNIYQENVKNEYIDPVGFTSPHGISETGIELSELLQNSFAWDSSPQGYTYWPEVFRMLRGVVIQPSSVVVREEPSEFPEFIV